MNSKEYKLYNAKPFLMYSSASESVISRKNPIPIDTRIHVGSSTFASQ